MAWPHRCSRCKRRHTFSRKWNQFVRQKRCWFCGNLRFFVDKWMQRRGREQACGCDGYWFPHRLKSKFCNFNPRAAEYRHAKHVEYQTRWGG